jgi:hypothetical protein
MHSRKIDEETLNKHEHKYLNESLKPVSWVGTDASACPCVYLNTVYSDNKPENLIHDTVAVVCEADTASLCREM